MGINLYISETAVKVLWILILATIIIIITFPFFLNRNIIQPLNNLLIGVKQIVNNGSLDVQVKVTYSDEIGFLTESFNSMIRSIKNYADNLENMVEQRTQELSEAKKETDRILENVDEGLFLIIQDKTSFIIGSQYSKILESIFMRNDISKAIFIELVSNYIDSSKLKDIDKFLKLMFRKIDENTRRVKSIK